jgi:hypothetical protein
VGKSIPPPETASPDELILLDAEPGRFAFWGWKNITVAVWWAQPDPTTVARLSRLTEQRRKQHSAGMSNIHLVKGNIALPDAETRHALVQLMRELGPYLAASAVVVGGDGFWASTMRSVITGMRVLTPHSYEMRLHSNIAEVVAWLPTVHARRTGVTVEPDALRAVLARANEEAPPAAPATS